VNFKKKREKKIPYFFLSSISALWCQGKRFFFFIGFFSLEKYHDNKITRLFYKLSGDNKINDFSYIYTSNAFF